MILKTKKLSWQVVVILGRGGGTKRNEFSRNVGPETSYKKRTVGLRLPLQLFAGELVREWGG
jgi:hypothetical protein